MAEYEGAPGGARGQGAPDAEAELRARAEERLGAKRSFWSSVAGFVFLNVLCWVIWAVTGTHDDESGVPWPVWVLIPGIFIAWNAIRVFGPAARPTSEEQIRKEMRRLQGE